MPLTAKGEKIKGAMEEEYGKEKGERVFYASKNAGRISGVDNDEPYDLKAHMDSVRRGDAAGAIDSLMKRRAKL